MPRELRLAVAPLRDVRVVDGEGTGDPSWTIEGYAAVFDQETTLYDGRYFKITEDVAPGAFRDVLGRLEAGDGLVHFNHGHDMTSSMASTDVRGIGGLELDETAYGLRFFARVDQEDPDAIRLATKMRRGVVNQASFAFTIEREELTITDDEDHYRILDVKDLYDVCACAQGAYPQTESSIRGLLSASIGRAGIDPAGFSRRDDAGATAGDSEGVPIAAAAGAVGRAEITSVRALAIAIRADLAKGSRERIKLL